jgi:arylsulfatase A
MKNSKPMKTSCFCEIVHYFSLALLAFGHVFVGNSIARGAEEELPNFIVIMVDDLGAVDLGCYGGSYVQTPNIDQLAKEGIRATRAYAAAAICSPTRAAWVTGRHPARLGITDWIRARFQRPNSPPLDASRVKADEVSYDENPSQKYRTPANPFFLPLSEMTVAELVKQKGYRTAHIGKWHLGDDPWYPEHQGYDKNFGGCDYGQPPTYFDPYRKPNAKQESLRNGIPGLPGRKENEFLTDREVDEAIQLIGQWKDSPFYIQLNHYAVHTPIEAPAELTKKYQRADKRDQQAKYAALLETVDRGLGKLRSAISAHAMKRPTVIIFTSDNGGLDQNGSPTENAPLRDGKGTPYEGGLRVPLLIYGDGLLPGGVTLDSPVCSMDLFPTVCELTKQKTPENILLDGISLLPLIHNQTTDQPARRLVWHFPHYRGETIPYSVLLENDWKLIHHYGAPAELYYLADDPYETNDLSESQKERATAMKAVLFQELDRLGASLPIQK